MSRKVWAKRELPYVIGRTAIMTEVGPEGIKLWRKGRREWGMVPWDKVILTAFGMRAIYTGQPGDPQLEPPAPPEIGGIP